MKPISSDAIVVLPLPLSPTIAVIVGESASTVKFMFFSATVLFLDSRPPPYTFVTLRSSISAVMAHLVQMAGNPALGANLLEPGALLGADIHRVWAARVKQAPRRQA